MPYGQLLPAFPRLTLMRHPTRHTASGLLLAAAAGLALTLGGCAVPVADGYGYGYEGYGPAYPPAAYAVPAGPPVFYGEPPLMFGGPIWIDATRRPPPPPHWRGGPRWREDGHGAGPRRPDPDRWRQQQRPRERAPDVRPRPGAPWQGRPPSPPQGRESPPNRDMGHRSGLSPRDLP